MGLDKALISLILWLQRKEQRGQHPPISSWQICCCAGGGKSSRADRFYCLMWLSCCPGARQTRAQWSKGKRRVRAALNSFLPARSPGEGSWARPLPPPPLGWHGEDESAKCIQEREHNGINAERRGECVNTSVVGKKWNSNWAFVWCSEAGRAGRHQWIESLTLCQIYQVINLHLLHYFIIQCSRRPAGIELTKRPLRYTAVADAALVRQNFEFNWSITENNNNQEIILLKGDILNSQSWQWLPATWPNLC